MSHPEASLISIFINFMNVTSKNKTNVGIFAQTCKNTRIEIDKK